MQRLVSREGLSEKEANDRINSQMKIDDKKQLAAFIIDNRENLGHLQNEVESFVEYIRKKYPNIKI
jgi:dephospho-CoA kinase